MPVAAHAKIIFHTPRPHIAPLMTRIFRAMFDWQARAPDDPEGFIWDFVIIGAGLGGSVAGHELAKQGFSVLFLERGDALPEYVASLRGGRLKRFLGTEPPERRMADMGQWPRRISLKQGAKIVDFFATMGNGPGGSSTVYGGALERLRRVDFETHASDANNEMALPNAWPISYETFAPFYQQAESLLEVAGTPDPGDADDDGNLAIPPKLTERDAFFFQSFADRGLAPYRLHVGFRYTQGCKECLGIPCKLGCKSEGSSRALQPAIAEHGARILLNCEVTTLAHDATRVTAVLARIGDKRLRIRAVTFIAAAGALNTPILLLNSTSAHWPDGLGNANGLIGRGLMFHCSDIVILRASRRLNADGPRKTLSTRAFYIIDGLKGGSFQSMGLPVYHGHVFEFLQKRLDLLLPWRIPALRIFVKALSVVAAEFYRDASLFATIVEDFPYCGNRVTPDPIRPSGFVIDYTKPEGLQSRIGLMRAKIENTLRAHKPIILSGGENLNFGHPMGTCRFGMDPATSVLDVDNKLRGVENLYVVDASFFPSSGGANPSLTIAANAIRVAVGLAGRTQTDKAAAADRQGI